MGTGHVLDPSPASKNAISRDWDLSSSKCQVLSLPPYAPFLNLIEEVWRKLKGILMPRRCYNAVAELRAALLTGLKILGARFI